MNAIPYPAHPKDRGQWAELLFMATAARLGLKVARPYGDNARYDVIVETDGQLHRVQVKCTNDHRCKSFATRCSYYRAAPPVRRARTDASKRRGRGQSTPGRRRHRNERYTKSDVDFMAVYIIADDSWFIIPIERIHSTALALPQKSGSARLRRWEQFREAWHLLGASSSSGVSLDTAD